MKRLTLIFIIVSMVVGAKSQSKSHFLSVNIGLSAPMSDYASTDGDNESSGFAMPGVNFALEGAGFINQTVGFGGYVGVNAHNIDDVAYTDEINRMGGYDNSLMSADPYTITNFMAGIYLNIPATEVVSFRFKLLGGIFSASTPDMTITLVDYEYGSYTFDITEAKDSNFAPLLGGSAVFKLSDRIGLSANVEYTGSECEFKYDDGFEVMTITQKLSIFNATAGLNIFL